MDNLEMTKYYRRGYMSGFEKFTHRQSRVYKEPTATISRSKYISLNMVAMTKFVGENKYAVLYFDKENQLIGIKFSKESVPESYKIRKYRDNRLGSITAISFLKYYKIPHDKTKTYPIEWNEQERMIIIDLKKNIQDSVLFDDSEEVPF